MQEKELRLALICYGGISLAIYMHGITKELWHVARASRALHAGEEPGPGSASVFHDLLGEVADRVGLRVRVLIDIVAGASAGGINGIFLGQAISTGQSLDPLTELWLGSADIEALIGSEASPRSRFSKAWAAPLAWVAAGRGARTLDDLEGETRDEVRAKLSHLVRSRWFEPPFEGPGFTRLLLDAFDAMAVTARGPRLLPDRQPLDLFVTATDFVGHPERLRLNSPPEVTETEHRLVFPFSDRGARVETLAAIPELAFAARATSSFPGAFPPFTVGELDGVLAKREAEWPGRDDFLRRMLPGRTSAEAAESAVLIDGSVLANAPFRPAIDALRERPARRPIDRRFVYIDPTPGTRSFSIAAQEGVPGFFKTILGAISALPRQQPIRDNLEVITERSERIERMRSIVAAIRPEVEAEVEALFGRSLSLDRPSAARLMAWRRRAQAAAAERAGYGHAAYQQLKLTGVIEQITTLLHAVGGESGERRRRRIRAAVAEAVAARGVGRASFAGRAAPAAIDFLRAHDLAFRVRRFRLLARRLEEIGGDEAALQPMRDAIFESLSTCLDRGNADSHAALRDAVRADDPDGGALLDSLAESMDLPRLEAETDQRLAAAFASLPKQLRRPLLLNYLGFPYYDVATLPMLQGEGLDEFDPIKVDRIAPEDARSIRVGGAEATLKGVRFNSFGAFFSRTYRENDYLWGRLHGAERAIDIIVSTLPAGHGLEPGRVAAIKRRTFLAILDEEERRLTAIAALFATLRREIG